LCVGDSRVFVTASCGLHAHSASFLLCFCRGIIISID